MAGIRLGYVISQPDNIEYLSADDEDRVLVAQASTEVDKAGRITENRIRARVKGDFPIVIFSPSIFTESLYFNVMQSPMSNFTPNTSFMKIVRSYVCIWGRLKSKTVDSKTRVPLSMSTQI